MYGKFPVKLKCADVSTVDDPTEAKNYRSLKDLPGGPKILQRLMHKQIIFHIDQILFS